mmetsp:Transcript_10855/g.17985  ORF Transcript_10855/g.17985 Transcript_10855/m.17985 type:complete len:209 (-) Transcript_10855:606-1232(-)
MGDRKEQHFQTNEHVLKGQSLFARILVGGILPPTTGVQTHNNVNNQSLPKGHKHNSLYAQELGKGLNPTQIGRHGMIELEKTGECQKYRHILHHTDPKLRRCEIFLHLFGGITTIIVPSRGRVVIIFNHERGHDKRCHRCQWSTKDELHGENLTFQQDGIGLGSRRFFWWWVVESFEPTGRILEVICVFRQGLHCYRSIATTQDGNEE